MAWLGLLAGGGARITGLAGLLPVDGVDCPLVEPETTDCRFTLGTGMPEDGFVVLEAGESAMKVWMS